MKWYERKRMEWIASYLRVNGAIGRAELRAEFNISEAQASLDLRRFARAHPKGMTYDTSRKCYVGHPEHLPHAPSHAEEYRDAHVYLNHKGIPNVAADGEPLTLVARLKHMISLEHHFEALNHEAVRLREERKVPQ